MRKKLNENPQVQLAVLGVVGVFFAIVMFTMVLKKDPVPADSAAVTGAPPSAAPSTEAPPAAVPAPDGSVAPAPGAPAGSPEPPPVNVGPDSKVTPGKGLPKPVAAAYKDDKAVVLLVIDPDGISDRAVEGYTKRLSSNKNVAVFTVDTADVSRYSRITEGVGVSQAPALIVVQPKSNAKGVPLAAVSYGFRNNKSVQIALEDGLYNGPTRQSFPE